MSKAHVMRDNIGAATREISLQRTDGCLYDS